MAEETTSGGDERPGVLLVYATSEGQTGKIADRIADRLDERGLAVDEWYVGDLPRDVAVADYDAVLVGASIHMGRHQKAAKQWVRNNREALAAVPSGFVQVSLTASDPEKDEEAAEYVLELVEATGWEPDAVLSAAGALRFEEYGFIKRAMMKRIAASEGMDTDHDQEFTDWDEVDAFADEFAGLVEASVAS